MTDQKKIRTFYPSAHVQSGWSPKGTVYQVVHRKPSGGIEPLSPWRPTAAQAWAEAVRRLARSGPQETGKTP
jgi:hypothetical protein